MHGRVAVLSQSVLVNSGPGVPVECPQECSGRMHGLKVRDFILLSQSKAGSRAAGWRGGNGRKPNTSLSQGCEPLAGAPALPWSALPVPCSWDLDRGHGADLSGSTGIWPPRAAEQQSERQVVERNRARSRWDLRPRERHSHHDGWNPAGLAGGPATPAPAIPANSGCSCAGSRLNPIVLVADPCVACLQAPSAVLTYSHFSHSRCCTPWTNPSEFR